MRYAIDKMTLADVPRVTEIERQAYPSTWPSSAYRKELQDNRWAYYIVVRDKQLAEERTVEAQETEKTRKSRVFSLPFLASRSITTAPSPETASIVGFAGLWLMVDEAHVTTLALHPEYRGRGLGELLLAHLIDISYTIGAKWVTLEVRKSNYIAQNLYRKYGFHEAGVRVRYYSDNHEDAVIMWTDEINSPAYKAKFQKLKDLLNKKLESF